MYISPQRSLAQSHCEAEECTLSKMYVPDVEFRSCFQTCNNITLNVKAKQNVIPCLCTVVCEAGSTPQSDIVSAFELP